jgi:hypothetical protein
MTLKQKEAQRLAALERALYRMQEATRLYCFELKYGKISQN